VTKKIPEETWATELHRFTSRNAGRTAALDVDSPDFGDMTGQDALSLRGITYDSRAERLLITLSRQGTPHMAHVTHAITDATAVFLLVDYKGRDEAIAIHQKHMSTLLRFVDL
jgi:hypothetical protein